MTAAPRPIAALIIPQPTIILTFPKPTAISPTVLADGLPCVAGSGKLLQHGHIEIRQRQFDCAIVSARRLNEISAPKRGRGLSNGHECNVAADAVLEMIADARAVVDLVVARVANLVDDQIDDALSHLWLRLGRRSP